MNLQAKFGEQEMKLTAPFKDITVVESVKPVYQEKTVTPTEEEQRVVADAGFDALYAVNVEPIPSEYTNTSGATATEDEIFLDKTSFANGKKLTGKFTIEEEVESQNSLIATIKTALEGKASSLGDTLKTLLDATKSTNNLFYRSTITTAEGLIPYSATENVTVTSSMFNSCSNLTTVPLFDTGNVTAMQSMFSTCYKLTSVPLFNTSKVTTMNNMFNSCTALTSVPLFDTSNVTDMSYMFFACSKLTTLPLFDASKVTTMSYTFYSCANLKKIVLEKISSKVTSSGNWFYGCKLLEVIYFKDATGVPTLTNTNAFIDVPSTCKVVIPDALYDEWKNKTNWSAINVTWVKESEYDDNQL